MLVTRRPVRPYHRKLPREPMRWLVRPADAARSPAEPALDRHRGLTRLGRSQSVQLAGLLVGLPILRILSSPALRCRQTVLPLARELRLEVQPCALLAADADPRAVLDMLRGVDTENTVLCTHRATLLGVLAVLTPSGRRIVDGLTPMPPAAAWALTGCPDRPAGLRYLPSPAGSAVPLPRDEVA